MWQKAVAGMLGAAAFAAAHPAATTPTPTATSVSNNACAQLATSQSSYLRASPSATGYYQYDYDVVRQCARSVPIDKSDATALLTGLSAVLEFQSDLEYKTNPPPGYLLKGVDIQQSLKTLNESVLTGNLTNEWDLQTAIQRIYGAAHDGHMFFFSDIFGVFGSRRSFLSPLTSLSWDGVEAPKIYFYNDVMNYLNGTASKPQAITQINGLDAAAFVENEQQNKTYGSFQDPDALYNSYFFSLASGSQGVGNYPGIFQGFSLGDVGPSTTIRYDNGSSVTLSNYGTVLSNFTGITNGNDVYQAFLNWTVKDEELSSRSASSASVTATATGTAATRSASATSSSAPRPTQLTGYPLPVAISQDATASGYFLTQPGFENTAVLVLRSMSEDYPDSFQATVKFFFDRCRAANKTHLILDIQGNGGGTVALGYDVFKQLFPDLYPYGAGNYRAHRGFELLGEAVTPIGEEILRKNPDNFSTIYVSSAFAATTYLNATGQPYTNFSNYYGPFENGHGNYTNLNRIDLENPAYNEAFGSIIISYEANSTDRAPQPFRSENIIILSDGRCGSTCTIMTHFLKWQGKVKQIVTGGRPSNTGAMQTIGGIKGSQVYYLPYLSNLIRNLYKTLSPAVLGTWNGTSLETIYDYAGYLSLRTVSAGMTPTEISFNYQNNIAEGDASRTPLQYVYEAADCRMYYQPRHIANITYQWLDVAANAFGLNGTSTFAKCVSGSTNAPSSLSGNATLYNQGVGQNSTLTGFLRPGTNAFRV